MAAQTLVVYRPGKPPRKGGGQKRAPVETGFQHGPACRDPAIADQAQPAAVGESQGVDRDRIGRCSRWGPDRD